MLRAFLLLLHKCITYALPADEPSLPVGASTLRSEVGTLTTSYSSA